MPSAPQICTDRSTTRPTASATNVFAIELDCAALRPWSSSAQACQISSRDAARSISESATIACTMPRSPSLEPNSSRSAARRTAMSWACRAMPSQRMQWVSRAGASRTWA